MKKKISDYFSRGDTIFTITIVILGIIFFTWKGLWWPKEIKSEIKIAQKERAEINKKIEEQENCYDEIKEKIQQKITRNDLEKAIDKAIKPIDDKLNDLKGWIKILYEKQMGTPPHSNQPGG